MAIYSGMIFPLKMVIFHCYVSSPEGTYHQYIPRPLQEEQLQGVDCLVAGWLEKIAVKSPSHKGSF